MIKNFDSNNIKIDEKSYKNIFIYHIGYVTIKDSKYVKIISLNLLYEEILIKIRDLIRSLTKNSDDYGKRYMKIKFYLDDELPLNKTVEIPSTAIVVRAIFYENNKYYLQVLFRRMCV